MLRRGAVVAAAGAVVLVAAQLNGGADEPARISAGAPSPGTPTGSVPAAGVGTTPTGPGVPSTPAQKQQPSAGAPQPAAGGTQSAAAAADRRPVTLAFAGDVHFEGSAASALGGDIGSAGRLLARADLAVVNLETAVTERGVAEPKQFSFRAPARAMTALRRAGVDAVSIANNHGMDYGRVGLADTLAAGARARLPVLGGGRTATEAWTPLRVTKRGVRISVVAATDVLDYLTWIADSDRSGLASAKDPERLLAVVRAEAQRSDVVVVFLHWGVERVVCPTARQQELARLLSSAGADLVVGSHAHVVQPQAQVGRTVVKYGMGNFVWYSGGGAGARTGVFTATVDRTGVRSTAWLPATIRGGRPQALSAADARQRRAEETRRAASCG
jgi:poly-gamma-glutamate synthesis protein (capsule biosynthesis protein)